MVETNKGQQYTITNFKTRENKNRPLIALAVDQKLINNEWVMGNPVSAVKYQTPFFELGADILFLNYEAKVDDFINEIHG